MVRDFQKDLANARDAEQLVLDTFAALSNSYKFINVGAAKEYRYKGDILAIAADGREIGIEVKDDSRIADTHNVLCEEKVYYYDGGYFGKGNMQSNYDIYCVLSRAEGKIYVFDFSIMKAKYKRGIEKEIKHYDQITFCYLVSLEQFEKMGALIATIDINIMGVEQ